MLLYWYYYYYINSFWLRRCQYKMTGWDRNHGLTVLSLRVNLSHVSLETNPWDSLVAGEDFKKPTNQTNNYPSSPYYAGCLYTCVFSQPASVTATTWRESPCGWPIPAVCCTHSSNTVARRWDHTTTSQSPNSTNAVKVLHKVSKGYPWSL